MLARARDRAEAGPHSCSRGDAALGHFDTPWCRSRRAKWRVLPSARDRSSRRLSRSNCDRTASGNALSRCPPNRQLRAAFDHLRLNRYYNPSPMSGSGLHAYAPLLIHLLLAIALAGALTAVSVLVGWRRPNRAKLQAYECGMEPTGDARQPFSVKFYLVAMGFFLFYVEGIFLFPWAYIYRDMFKISYSFGVYGFVEMLVYIAILLVGYIYLWKKGAFDWHR